MEQPKGFNILVTGSVGCGKTSLSEMLAEEYGLNHVNVGSIVKDQKFFSEYDEHFDTHILTEPDEERLMDYMEPIMIKGNNVVDHHTCSFFPERWFHAVIVLEADTEPLFDRLTRRGYSEHKREENMTAAITRVVVEEALNSYKENIVFIRQSNTMDDMLSTVAFVGQLIEELAPTKSSD